MREQPLLTEGKYFVCVARCRAEILPCARCGETLKMLCLKSEVGFEAGAGIGVWSPASQPAQGEEPTFSLSRNHAAVFERIKICR